ncbi:hypothetical protein OAA06_02310, partial [bacterium]|nr:hypothetical protein [bacterium]
IYNLNSGARILSYQTFNEIDIYLKKLINASLQKPSDKNAIYNIDKSKSIRLGSKVNYKRNIL